MSGVYPGVASPQLLARPVAGDILQLYLAISEHALSSVLIKEEEKVQRPVYYISRVMGGAETRSGTGILLWSLESNRIEYAFQFAFKDTNNEAEHEALANERQPQLDDTGGSCPLSSPIKDRSSPFARNEPPGEPYPSSPQPSGGPRPSGLAPRGSDPQKPSWDVTLGATSSAYQPWRVLGRARHPVLGHGCIWQWRKGRHDNA
ncbi:hypothetical protein LIER_04337 [Lithospermum erythrorhizon]|uniref:Uncharacterized protein n=1 Tax=Lithospermum erythrorhizon TaxID=34254 RepID=A0AAV3NWL0_LITER